MKYGSLLIICFFTLGTVLTSCERKNKVITLRKSIVNFNIKRGPQLRADEWHCYNIEDEKICIPITWKYMDTTILFFAKTDTTDDNSFFGVLKLNENKAGISVSDYIRNDYKALKSDTLLKLVDYQAIKLIYSDKDVFRFEFYSEFNKTSYITRSTIFEKDGVLFDLVLRIRKSQCSNYCENYENVVNNFYHKNKLIFSDSDKIINGEVVKL